MIRRLAIALQRLTRRERALLAALALAGPLLLGVFGVIVPLASARDAAEAEVSEASALADWVAGRAAELVALQARQATGAVAATQPIGLSGVEQSLTETGLRDAVSRLSNRPDGQVELGFDEVRFSALTDWLAQVEPGWGYQFLAFRIEAGELGDLVRADFTLLPADAP